MSFSDNEVYFKLEGAVEKCKRQGKVCLWHTKSTIVVAGNFSSLQQLKSLHPHLFELTGTLCVA